MSAWLDKLLGRRSPRAAAGESPLESSSDARRLALELEERERRVAELEREVARLGERSEGLARATGQAQVERLVTDLSRPLCLLLALTADQGGAPAREEDVANLVGQVTRVLADYGWQALGEVGRPVPFDPDQHLLLSHDPAPQVGRMVVVFCPGATYGGRVVLRAGVTLAQEEVS